MPWRVARVWARLSSWQLKVASRTVMAMAAMRTASRRVRAAVTLVMVMVATLTAAEAARALS